MAETLLSVGIDIGTSTTQLILSELSIENMASVFTIPRISITDKKVIFKSDIIFTPILENNLIDSDGIKEFVEEQYKKAGITKSAIQTGAVIITGETVRKENARSVANALSGFAGDFVVATAGPDLESIIAGKGAGTYSYSKNHHTTAVNLDIGGGTTNLVVFNDGDIEDTACFDIGGRLIKVDSSGIIRYISPKVEKIIRKEALDLRLNEKVDLKELDKLLDIFVQVLENSVRIGKRSPYFELLITNKQLTTKLQIKCISFSGGVADGITKEGVQNPFEYGDIGLLLGKKIRESSLMTALNVIPTVETIRATVVGAGSHTTDVSGSTITYKKEILPLQNIPILQLSKDDEDANNCGNLGNIIQEKVKWFMVDGEVQTVGLGIEGVHNPSFQLIQNLAREIIEGLDLLIQKKLPLVIIVKEDMAKALGHSLYAHLPENYPFVCIDSVYVRNGDYIDIGKPIAEGSVLPVVVKTLVFN
ncbi:ethanolamine ammonia-lyase reactivating factor EutA [Alkaliphilus oremlandii]|uniref:Ethanolamine utilisation EutA n=1 Tax=Alkaliphilus oremlandii (strain OhILAs) TaxID=350688 RepID=A8MEL8_ALKOO|nr:ethanolamine ammonia-lyase reactivating factor EutA [Alkaliphilus oremlandii]ABW18347.1 Ethanolamine utilisation EutA [Alkaliphilus oremlandii OhILAs]